MSATISPHERLRALAATVTMGTDRVGGAHSTPDALLTDAAWLGIQARAGWKPLTHPVRLPAAPVDTAPSAPKAAIATLVGLLGDPDPLLLEEWAQLALMHGVCVDGSTAPLVLDWWARQTRRSPAIFAALGHRGEWLASLNPDWQKPIATAEVPAGAEDLWQTGTSAERLALLTAVRRQDPNRARALVESTWRSDSAADRQNFLEVLSEHASMADEAFLEAALDDRSKLVRKEAAAILALIPASRLRQRLADLANTMVKTEMTRHTLTRRSRHRVVLSPPDSFAPSWERDGIERRPPQGIGERAWWMRQILALAGLGVWARLGDFTPDVILESLQDDDYFADAVQALIAASRAAADPAWSAALIRRLLDQAAIDLDSIATLLEGLPDSQRESLALDTLAKAPLTAVDCWTILATFDRPWSAAFSTAAMALLGARTADASDPWRLARAIDDVSRRISADAVEAFDHAVVRSFQGAPADSASRSIERLRLRAAMHKEFTS